MNIDVPAGVGASSLDDKNRLSGMTATITLLVPTVRFNSLGSRSQDN